MYIKSKRIDYFIIIILLSDEPQENKHLFLQYNFKQDNNMKTIHDFAQADISPYEGSLKNRLNETAKYRVISFGNARVDLEKYQNNTTAKIALTQKVDRETFIKVFRESIRYIAQLSRTAQAVLWYIMDNLPQNKGYVVIDNMTVMEFCHFKNRKSVRDGVVELLEKNFLTRTTVPKKFWVNPLIVFNGNRITYANEYILDEADED